ncbi:MAG: hypothetical protein R3C11_25150 [Planctomycetaceae bacterium]
MNPVILIAIGVLLIVNSLVMAVTLRAAFTIYNKLFSKQELTLATSPSESEQVTVDEDHTRLKDPQMGSAFAISLGTLLIIFAFNLVLFIFLKNGSNAFDFDPNGPASFLSLAGIPAQILLLAVFLASKSYCSFGQGLIIAIFQILCQFGLFLFFTLFAGGIWYALN